jgi:hypothetical protein
MQSELSDALNVTEKSFQQSIADAPPRTIVFFTLALAFGCEV